MSDLELDEVDKHHQSRIQLSKGNKYDGAYSSEGSEDEVMNLSGNDSSASDDDDDDEEYFKGAGDEQGVNEEDDDDENWGGRENQYGGEDLDDIDNKEEAEELVKESLRLQKKHMSDLNMDDYIDEDLLADWKKSAHSYDDNDASADVGPDGISKKQKHLLQDVITEKNFQNLDENAKQDFIKSAFPEYFPLCQEFSSLYSETFTPLKAKVQSKDASKVELIKYVALSSYLASIINYINILASLMKSSGEEVLSMKDHPIMETILSSREAWRQARELKDVKAEDTVDELSLDEQNISDEEFDQQVGAHSDDEVSSIEQSESDDNEVDGHQKAQDEDDLDLSKLKRRNLRKRSVKANLDSTEGDLEAIDAEDKKARKKSLRFYTSKIDQQTAKKDARFAGDEDLPYKERLFERQQRLIEEARKRGLDKSDDATNLDNKDYDSNDEAVANDINNDYDAFYNSVKFAKEDKRNKRKETHKAVVKAAKEGKLNEILADENLANDGKRAINYQILKNKGLTAKRKKDTQNSRVKKRKKYEQAQKKLKSVRQVYKGQQGPYGGETTGIKKNLSRSVKFK